MTNKILIIALLAGLAILLLIISILAISYEHTKKANSDKKDWLFASFHEKMYSALFGNKNPEKVAKKLGINAEEYMSACKVVQVKPNLIRLIMNQLFGTVILALFGIITLLSGSVIYCLFGAVLFIIFAFAERSRLKSMANDRKAQMASELPRFIDLLQAELVVGLPVETAMLLLCEKTEEMLLSREFLQAYGDMRLGASSWSKSLENVAARYDIDELSAFVLDMMTSYNKGVSVTNAVVRKAADIKKSRVLNIKEGAEKVTSRVLLPTMLFQLMPVVLFLIIPVYSQIQFTM